MEGVLKLDKRTPALIVTKKCVGGNKGDILAVGSKKDLKVMQEQLGVGEETTIDPIKAVTD